MEREGPVERPAEVVTTAPRPTRASVRRTVVQPSLEVGRVDDPLEREADAVADRVVAGPLHWPDDGVVRPRRRQDPAALSIAGIDINDPASGALDADADRRIQTRRRAAGSGGVSTSPTPRRECSTPTPTGGSRRRRGGGAPLDGDTPLAWSTRSMPTSVRCVCTRGRRSAT